MRAAGNDEWASREAVCSAGSTRSVSLRSRRGGSVIENDTLAASPHGWWRVSPGDSGRGCALSLHSVCDNLPKCVRNLGASFGVHTAGP